jgi:hypothetical protein
MNSYGWGTMMDDYTFLEGMSRKVADCGAEIVKGGLRSRGPEAGGRGFRARGRGRGGRGGRGRGGGGGGHRTKRDLLKLQLELRDIDIDLLPVGMKLQTLNRSMWDAKYVNIPIFTPVV